MRSSFGSVSVALAVGSDMYVYSVRWNSESASVKDAY